jgi:hypothetical protein
MGVVVSPHPAKQNDCAREPLKLSVAEAWDALLDHGDHTCPLFVAAAARWFCADDDE